MPRGRREWVQFELQSLPGAEAWVLVRHRRGCFKLPAVASVMELMRGVSEGWTMKSDAPHKTSHSVRIPYVEWLAYRSWRESNAGHVQARLGEPSSQPD